MIDWGKFDNMTWKFYPSPVLFAKHIFHLDIIIGTEETDKVKKERPSSNSGGGVQFFEHLCSNSILWTKMKYKLKMQFYDK